MKESLQRISVWVKAHPWQSALILGAVILLGYLVYKRSGGGGGGGGTGGAVSEPEGQAPVQSGIPDLGSISSPITSGGLSTVPSSETGTSSTTGYTPIPFLPGGKEKPVAIAPPENLGSFGSGAWAPDFSSSVAALVQPPSVAAKQPAPPNVQPTERLLPERAPKVAQDLATVYSTQTPGQQALGFRGDLGFSRAAQEKKTKTTSAKTPAMQYGKGKSFTGYIPGVGWFQNGYPTTFNNVAVESPVSQFAAHPQTVVMPGGKKAKITAGTH